MLAEADRYDPATGYGWALYESYALNDQGQVIGSGELFSGGVVIACDCFLLEGLGSGTVSIQPLGSADGFFLPRQKMRCLDHDPPLFPVFLYY